jgi:hypothetical protein
MINCTEVTATSTPQPQVRLQTIKSSARQRQTNLTARRACRTLRRHQSLIAHTPMNPQLATLVATDYSVRRVAAADRVHGGSLAAHCHESSPCRANTCAEAFPVVDINSI